MPTQTGPMSGPNAGGAPNAGGMGGMVGMVGAAGGAGEMSVGAGGMGPSTPAGGYQPCPDGEPCRILPLGDSITEGWVQVNGSYQMNGGYRVELFRLAVEAGQSITFVGSRSNGPDMVAGQSFPKAHEGTSGITVGDLHSQKIPSPGLDGDPHIILLHIGTNDMNQGANGAVDRLIALIDDLLEAQPDSLLVVSTIIPLPQAQGSVDGYNAEIPDIVQERADAGKHIILIDQSDFPTNRLNDNVHPDTEGYDVMGANWYEVIAGYLK